MFYFPQAAGQAGRGLPARGQLHRGVPARHPRGPPQVKISDEKSKNIYISHVRYRCEGTLVACQYAGAGCTFRGPNKKVREHQADCSYKKEGEYRVGKNFLHKFCKPGLIGGHCIALHHYKCKIFLG